MNTVEFCNALAQKGYTKSAAKTILDDVILTLTETLASGEDVQWHGFGSFEVRELAPRESIDMQTREKIVIPGHKSPKFVSGLALKRAVKEGIVRH